MGPVCPFIGNFSHTLSSSIPSLTMPFIGPFYVEPKTTTKYVRRDSNLVSQPGDMTTSLKSCLVAKARTPLHSPSENAHFFDDQHKRWIAHGTSHYIIFLFTKAEVCDHRNVKVSYCGNACARFLFPGPGTQRNGCRLQTSLQTYTASAYQSAIRTFCI